MFRSRSAENMPLLEAALARETVPRIREQMELALAASRLVARRMPRCKRAGHRPARRRRHHRGARALLLEARSANPDLAADDRRRARRHRRSRWPIRRAAETLFQGLSLGSVLLLAALGLAVTFGVMGVINMAHGEFVMLGAYATFVVQEACRGIPWLAPWSLPLAVPAAFLVAGRRGRGRWSAG